MPDLRFAVEDSPTDEEAASYVAALQQMEAQQAEPCTVKVGPFSLFVLIGTLQLSLRHPEFGGSSSAEIVRDILQVLREPFRGTPGEILVKMGDQPELDRQGTTTKKDHFVIQPDGGGPVIALACPKCREVVFCDDAEFAVKSSLAHAGACGTSDITVIELLPPAG